MSQPKVPDPAPPPPPPMAGADALKIGGDDNPTRSRGALGRLALRVGGS